MYFIAFFASLPSNKINLWWSVKVIRCVNGDGHKLPVCDLLLFYPSVHFIYVYNFFFLFKKSYFFKLLIISHTDVVCIYIYIELLKCYKVVMMK